MNRNVIFWPVLVQVLMTLLVYVRLIKVKVREPDCGTHVYGQCSTKESKAPNATAPQGGAK